MGWKSLQKIADSIFGEGPCVYGWIDKHTENSMDFDNYSKNMGIEKDAFKFQYDPENSISYEKIDQIFSTNTVEEKIRYLDHLSAQTNKNRFVHPIEETKKRKWFF